MTRRPALALGGLALALAVAGVAVAETPAHVRDPEDTWKPIAHDPDAEVAARAYDRAMLDGDTNLELAVAESQVRSRRKKYVERAITAYELAAMARPQAAEPHFRAASALHAFYIECRDDEPAALCDGDPLITSATSRLQAARVIRHWDAFEQKAPLDPRLVDEVLFERAILHTKLATREHLEAARLDYLKILAGRQVSGRDGNVMGNLAETDMMLGDLSQAILHYRRTLELEQNVSHYFGLAVALDRDEQGQQARQLLRSFGLRGVEELERMIRLHNVFYVPDGEAFYYLALGYESVGHLEEAISYYDLFLASGAHPQFAPRARANRTALAARRGATPRIYREGTSR